MEPNSREFYKQCAFQKFCNTVLHNEACDTHRELRRHKAKEVTFSDMTLDEARQLHTFDEYFKREAAETVFEKAGKKITPKLLLEAIRTLPEEKRKAIQGLFELAGVPVIGCGTLSSALCMDKDRAHQLAALAGIRVPRSHVFHSSDDFSRIAQAAEELGYPVFVKPVRAGSSFGITKVSGPEELPAAMEEAFRHDSAVILEETIPGFEVGCAVMGNEELTVGLVDEIALSEGFFNYEEKYTLKTSAIHCPARIPPEKAAEIQAAAKTIYRALDCRVFARVDLFLTPDGEIVFNEVNTIPGFTAHSRYPSMMQGIGISFGELVTRLIELGVVG